jgi:gentisate 1,2-dioxygenase
MKNNTLNNLKSEYEKLEIKPSADLWDRLDHKLDEKPENASKQSSEWWKYAAIILLMVSVGTIIYIKKQK